jgi:hypothetical protein
MLSIGYKVVTNRVNRASFLSFPIFLASVKNSLNSQGRSKRQEVRSDKQEARSKVSQQALLMIKLQRFGCLMHGY